MLSLVGALAGTGVMAFPHSDGIGKSPTTSNVNRMIASGASRSQARKALDGTASTPPATNGSSSTSDGSQSSTGAEAVQGRDAGSTGSQSNAGVGEVTGSWSLGKSNEMDVPYAKTPLEQVQDVMKTQTAKDLARLEGSDRHVDGFGTSKTSDGDLPLTKEMMAELSKVYRRTAPSGFDPSHETGDKGNAYSFSQCTWWAYVRRHQLGLPAGSHMGDGRMWASTARSLGYWVDRNPMVGDVIVFQPGQAGADGYYGHVGVVENVIELDGKKWVVTSESSAEYNGKHFSRILGDVERFEYIHS